jgi:hypothetical protein
MNPDDLNPVQAERGVVGSLAWWAMVVALSAGAILAAGSHLVGERSRERDVDETRAALGRIEREVRVRAATEGAEVNRFGWPASVQPAWFGGGLPENRLATGDRPWLEVAPETQFALEDPPVLIAERSGVASFWYNPGKGIVRARVGLRTTDAATLETYNRVNGTRVERLFLGGRSPARR